MIISSLKVVFTDIWTWRMTFSFQADPSVRQPQKRCRLSGRKKTPGWWWPSYCSFEAWSFKPGGIYFKPRRMHESICQGPTNHSTMGCDNITDVPCHLISNCFDCFRYMQTPIPTVLYLQHSHLLIGTLAHWDLQMFLANHEFPGQTPMKFKSNSNV